MTTRKYWTCNYCYEEGKESGDFDDYKRHKNTPCTFVGFNGAEPDQCPRSFGEGGPVWEQSRAFKVVDRNKKRKS